MYRLFDPVRIGDIIAPNRVVMAPLTRNRAGPGRVPTGLMATYYAQRASAGLIVAEATQISPAAQGYRDTPGIHTKEQIAAWRRVTELVHGQGGRIVLQLWHVGRISHVTFQPFGGPPLSSTARRANAKIFTVKGFEPASDPRPLSTDEIPAIVDEYRTAAGTALDAGFDGVEIHAASGYLLDQFLRDSINDRQDQYGGEIENRIRLVLEVLRSVAAEVGAGRTGLRVSPVNPVNDAGQDSNAQALFDRLIDHVALLNLAFIHVIEGSTSGPRDGAPFNYDLLRKRLRAGSRRTAWIANNGYTRETAMRAVSGGEADLVSFGRAYISNPDLVARLRSNASLAEFDRATLYGGGATGYTDYPRMSAAPAENDPAGSAKQSSIRHRPAGFASNC